MQHLPDHLLLSAGNCGDNFTGPCQPELTLIVSMHFIFQWKLYNNPAGPSENATTTHYQELFPLFFLYSFFVTSILLVVASYSAHCKKK